MGASNHELDDDSCCIYCGFDAAEWWHLEKQKPKDDRDPQPICEKRPLGKNEAQK